MAREILLFRISGLRGGGAGDADAAVCPGWLRL